MQSGEHGRPCSASTALVSAHESTRPGAAAASRRAGAVATGLTTAAAVAAVLVVPQHGDGHDRVVPAVTRGAAWTPSTGPASTPAPRRRSRHPARRRFPPHQQPVDEHHPEGRAGPSPSPPGAMGRHRFHRRCRRSRHHRSDAPGIRRGTRHRRPQRTHSRPRHPHPVHR
jgi:hypothetical protein